MAIDLPLEVMVMIVAALIEPYHLQVVLRPQTGRVEIIPKICLAKGTESDPALLTNDPILHTSILTVSKGLLSIVTDVLRSRFMGRTFIEFDTLNLIRSHYVRPNLIWRPELISEIHLDEFKETKPFHLDLSLYPNLKSLNIKLPGLETTTANFDPSSSSLWDSILKEQYWKHALKLPAWKQLRDIASMFHPAALNVEVVAIVDFEITCHRAWEKHRFRVDVGVSREGELVVLNPDDGSLDGPCVSYRERERIRRLRHRELMRPQAKLLERASLRTIEHQS